jgi:hypothetical protein
MRLHALRVANQLFQRAASLSDFGSFLQRCEHRLPTLEQTLRGRAARHWCALAPATVIRHIEIQFAMYRKGAALEIQFPPAGSTTALAILTGSI